MSKTSVIKNLCALAAGLVFVILADLALGLLGVAPLAEEDTLVGFAGSSPLFVAAGQTPDGGTLFERNPAKNRYFNPQQFSSPKPSNRFRIVTFGGSTTYGRPYLDDTSFSHWLGELLMRYGQNAQLETINTGGISYASYRVLRVMQEMVDYQPDLLIVYSGHNEFLEARTFAAQKNEDPGLRKLRSLLHRSRIYSLMKRTFDQFSGQDESTISLPGDEVVAQLEQVGGPELYQRDPNLRANVIRQYRESIEAMVALAHERQIPIILCTLPANLSGLSPFKSQHRADLTASDWLRWQALYEKGLQALGASNWTLALESFMAAEQIDAEFAELHYYKGQALEQLGDMSASYQAYARAKQEDIVPLRALDEFNRVLREVASRNELPLADVEAFVRRVSAGGIPGNNLFVDHVHPTIEGQQLVAWVILDAAVNGGLVPLSTQVWRANQVEARQYLRTQEQAISARYRAMGVWGVGRLYYWAGKHPEAYVSLREAWQTVKDIPEIPRKLGLLEVERGNGAAALEYFAAAERLDPGHPWGMLGMADAYNLTGEAEMALAVLQRLPEGREREPGYQSSRGQALLLLGRVEEGLAALQQAQRQAPAVPRSELLLAQAFAEHGRVGAAEEHFRKYLDLRQLPQSPEIVAQWLQQNTREGGQP